MQGKMSDVCIYDQTHKPAALRLGEGGDNGGHSVMSGACGLVRADGRCRDFSAYTVLSFNVPAYDLLRNLLGKQGQDCNSHLTDQIERRATCPQKWFLAQS